MPTPYQNAGAKPGNGDGDTYEKKTTNEEDFDPEDHADECEDLEGPGVSEAGMAKRSDADDEEALLDASERMDGINYPTTQPTPSEGGVRANLVSANGAPGSDPDTTEEPGLTEVNADEGDDDDEDEDDTF